MSRNLIGLLFFGGIMTLLLQSQEAAASPNLDVQPERLQAGTTCRIVMARRESLWESYAIWTTYEGTVTKAGKDGVLLAASVRSGFGYTQVPPIVHWLPVKYSWPLHLVPQKNIGIGLEELDGKEIWIPVKNIGAIELMTTIGDK